ncbi:conserved hypothetical protein [Burkholderia mallei GB8 horse 4]|nr:conserved hypothetical protein [Burkholderia mallei GB8 horse 4]
MLILQRRWVWVSMIERKIWSSSAVSLSMVFVRITCCHFAAWHTWPICREGDCMASGASPV